MLILSFPFIHAYTFGALAYRLKCPGIDLLSTNRGTISAVLA